MSTNKEICYRVGFGSTLLTIRYVSAYYVDGKPRKGYYATKEEAEKVFRKEMTDRIEERKKLEPNAIALLKEKAAQLDEFLNTLGVEVYAEGTALDDTGMDVWIELSCELEGEHQSHIYRMNFDRKEIQQLKEPRGIPLLA